MNREQRRVCRKHWRLWKTKTSGDGTQLTYCPMCDCEVPSEEAHRVAGAR